jgi:hypothetical protein
MRVPLRGCSNAHFEGILLPLPLVEGEFHTAIFYRYGFMQSSFGFESQPFEGQGDKGVVVGTGVFVQE